MCVPDSGPENMAAKPADKAAIGTRFGMLYTGRVPKMAPGTRLGPDNSPDPAPAPPPSPAPAPAAPQLQTPTTVEQKKVRGTRTVRKKTNRQSISTGINASAPTGAGSGGLNI